MEAVTDGEALDDSIFGLLAGIEIGIDVFNLIQDCGGLVAVDVALLIVGLQSVAFDNEQRIIIESCNLGGFPCQEVHINVAVPLGYNRGFAAIDHQQAVEDNNHRPVGLMRTATDIDDSEVAVCDFFRVVRVDGVGEIPDPEHALRVGPEAEVAEGVFALIGVGIDVADVAWRFSGCGPEGLDGVFIEYRRAGVDERLDIVGGVFGSHGCVVVVFGALLDIPMDTLEGCTDRP